MADLTDLKARLRYIKGVCDEAADAIEALEAKLTAVLERDWRETAKAWQERAEKAEADLAAARKALRDLDAELRANRDGHTVRKHHAPAIAAARAEGGA